MPTALVTGSSSGFGRATSERLAGLGWSVIGAQRDPSVVSPDAPYRTTAIDLRDAASIARVGSEVDALEGGLDALVSNAGYGILGPWEEMTDAEFRDQLEVNVVGTMAVCRACLPALRRAKGVIVQVSSVGGQAVSAGFGAYGASKFALEGASEALAEEVEPQGVRVVLVEPGAFRTSIAAKSPTPTARQSNGRYEGLWREIDDFISYLGSEEVPGAGPAIDAIVAAVTTPGAPFRLPVGDGIADSIRKHAAGVVADVDAAEAFLAATRESVRKVSA